MTGKPNRGVSLARGGPCHHRRVAVHVAAYDPDWPRQFAAERSALEELLAPWLSGPVEHIGSTAVPGLDAKPILDMLAPVSDLAAAEAAIPVLARRSYVHAQHRPAALYFFRPAIPAASGHTHHVHLTERGSDLRQERIAFRDALRADPALARQYQHLKDTLVAAVLAAAGIALQPRPPAS
jgi:GrpB-like predicted nucleotidyltransferase (UPF0157 family)